MTAVSVMDWFGLIGRSIDRLVGDSVVNIVLGDSVAWWVGVCVSVCKESRGAVLRLVS